MRLDDSDATILDLLRAGPLSSTELAARLGLSRQATHSRLRRLAGDGLLLSEGQARATRYRLPPPRAWERHFPLAGLAEDEVYRILAEEVPPIGKLEAEAASLVNYVVTELVNNAIDHSSGRELRIAARWSPTQPRPRLTLEIEDDGVGAFIHVRDALGLPSQLAAIQELSKGKTTTAPEHHTGEGLFFTSKAVDQFRLESDNLAWIIDNELIEGEDGGSDRGEMAVMEVAPARHGTLVAVEMDLSRPRSLTALFERYTDNFEFTKTRTVVRLFSIGVRFVSRSEAKRLLHGLDRFREVVLDFRGVEGVGQGFADEVFRVWAHAHPDTELTPVNMNPAVEFMVQRAGGRA